MGNGMNGDAGTRNNEKTEMLVRLTARLEEYNKDLVNEVNLLRVIARKDNGTIKRLKEENRYLKKRVIELEGK
jgi:hypothetical protein